MTKTILLTGATDGIGLETARMLAGIGRETAKRLVAGGHTVLIHGRSELKLEDTKALLSEIDGAEAIETYQADLSKIRDTERMASAIANDHKAIDVIINNAGVFSLPNPVTVDGYDVRFIVNTIAPYLLTKRLLPLLPVAWLTCLPPRRPR